MRSDAGLSGDAQRIEQMTWLFFLKVYDAQEELWEYDEDKHYVSVIPEKLRWRNWAVDNQDGECLTGDALLKFANEELFPELKKLQLTHDSPRSHWIIKEVFSDLNQYMKNGILLRQMVNVIDEIDFSDADDRHTFGDIYESILKDLQSAGNAGEFYTPRALTDFIVEMLNPRLGEKMADFTSGTGGFLTSTLNYLEKQKVTPEDERKWQNSVLGQEWKPLPYLLSITNLMVHNVDEPNIYHCDSLGVPVSSFKEKDKVDVIAMNPPYGGTTEASAKQNFPSDMRSSETADLFMVLIMRRLKTNGRAGVIIPDGFLFGTDGAKLNIKTALLKEFNVHTIIRLPGSIFSPYTSINTNIVFFNNETAEGAPEGYHTNKTWFYRLDMPEGYKHFSKTKPMRLEHCQPIRDWWNDRHEIITKDEDGNVVDEKSRCFTATELVGKSCNFDQCKFPKEDEEILPPAELLADYHKRREALIKSIDSSIENIEKILYQDDNIKSSGMTVKCLNELADLMTTLPDRLRKSILQEAIQGRLVPQNADDEPASVLLKKIRKEKENLVKQGKLKKKDLEVKPIENEEKPFEIPESWRWCRYEDIARCELGKTKNPNDKKDELHQYLCAKNVYWNRIDLSEIKEMPFLGSEKEKYSLHRNDMLICEGGEAGRTAIWEYEDKEMYFQNALHRVRFFGSIIPQFFMYQMMYYAFAGYLHGCIKGATIKHFVLSELKNLSIPLPPLAEQRRIVAKVEALFAAVGR